MANRSFLSLRPFMSLKTVLLVLVPLMVFSCWHSATYLSGPQVSCGGFVLNALGDAVGGVSVTLTYRHSDDPPNVMHTITDAEGRFDFSVASIWRGNYPTSAQLVAVADTVVERCWPGTTVRALPPNTGGGSRRTIEVVNSTGFPIGFQIAEIPYTLWEIPTPLASHLVEIPGDTASLCILQFDTTSECRFDITLVVAGGVYDVIETPGAPQGDLSVRTR